MVDMMHESDMMREEMREHDDVVLLSNVRVCVRETPSNDACPLSRVRYMLLYMLYTVLKGR